MAQIEYDEEGGISLYFFAAFWGLVLIPLTYFYWPRGQKRIASSVPCKCKQCALKNELLSRRNPSSSLANWLKRVLFLIGWVILLLLIMQAAKVEKDYVDYDPYQILNVDRGASKNEIKKAYRELSLIYHPDKEGGDEVMFMKISKAHAALTDDEARENWEKYGNPDGPKAATFGIALPSWIVDKNNSIYVLGIYVACFMIILPLVVSIWWSKSNKTAGEKIHIFTNQLYHDYIHRTPGMSLKMVLKVLSTSFEFDKKSNPEMIFRPSDEQEIKKVQRELPTAQEDKKTAAATKVFSYPHSVKARTILNAHMHRVSLPPKTLEIDRQYIIRKTPMLLQEMVNIFVQLLFLYFQRRVPNKVKLVSLESMIKLHQYLVQGVGEGKSPLLQLPHLHESQLKLLNIRKREVRTLEALARLSSRERESILNFMEQQEYQDLMNVLGMLPVVTLEVEIQVIDDENRQEITAHSIVTVKCKLKRDSFRNVYFNQHSEKVSETQSNGIPNGSPKSNGYLAVQQSQNNNPSSNVNKAPKQNKPKKGAGKKQVRGGKKKNHLSQESNSENKPIPESAKGDEPSENTAEDDDINSVAPSETPDIDKESSEIQDQNNNNHDDSSDGELWDPEEDPAKKLRELLDSKPKTSVEVHCPYFPEIRQEGWWVYLCEAKSHTLKSPVEKVSGLKDTDSVELKFTAPEKGHYTYNLHVRSDCYVGLDVERELKINVLAAKVVEESKLAYFSEDEEEEEEKKSDASGEETMSESDNDDNNNNDKDEDVYTDLSDDEEAASSSSEK